MAYMCHIKLVNRIALVWLIILMAGVSVLGSRHDTVFAASGDEAPDSTIALQMPFIAGQRWIVGGGGSFYGEGLHTNANNDYYATDWNIVGGATDDLGKSVLPVADGAVSLVQAPPCPNTGVGCFVQIDHADGYLTKYGHLSAVSVTVNSSVHTGTLIGAVGRSGPPGLSPHLHLRFQRNGSSRCNTVIPPATTCPNLETPQAPQGHKPSPMMTTLGPTTLVDGSTYTSVNGRVYMPDLRNSSGWLTEFYLRNNGTEARDVTIYYFRTNGSPTPKVSDVCTLDPNQRCYIDVSYLNRIPAGTNGSAYIDGGEDVSVVVTQHKSYPDAWAAYTSILLPTSTIHIPLLHKNNYGYYSEIFVRNSGAGATNITVNFYPSPGYPGSACSQTYTNVPVNGLQVVSLGNIGCVGATFVGSAYITNNANNLLAVTSTQFLSDGTNMAESNTPELANTGYAPLIQNNNYGWITGIALQNASASSNNLSATYYNGTGSQCSANSYPGVGARVSQLAFNPGSPCSSVASAILSGGSHPVAVNVNQGLPGTPNLSAYEAVGVPAKAVTVPLWRYGVSGIEIQNVGGQTINATINFYDADGGQYGAPLTTPISPHAIYGALNVGPNDGSLVVTADQPVAVVINHLSSTGDRIMSHTGIHR